MKLFMQKKESERQLNLNSQIGLNSKIQAATNCYKKAWI